jgi:hypothetical protein
MTNTTFIDLGSIKTFAGAVMVNYVPERKQVHLYTHDPNDRRKAGVLVTLSAAEADQLIEMLTKAREMLRNQAGNPTRGAA